MAVTPTPLCGMTETPSSAIDSFWIYRDPVLKTSRVFRRWRQEKAVCNNSFDELIGFAWIPHGVSLTDWINKSFFANNFHSITENDLRTEFAPQLSQAEFHNCLYDLSCYNAVTVTNNDNSNNNTKNKERIDNSMAVWNIAITRNACEVERQQGMGETLVVPTDSTIVANNQNTALVLFGAKHADALTKSKASPDLLMVNIRQGV